MGVELSDPNDPGITRQTQGDTLYIMGVTLNLDQGDIPYVTPPNGVAVPGTMDVLIYADTVTLSGAITNPGRKIQIVARRLAVTAAATIDVSGPAGSPNTAPGVLPDQPNQGYAAAGASGVDGGAGVSGGSIAIYVAEMTGAAEGSAPANLILNANGGAGGRGQDGGNGIQGAPGQQGVTPVWPNYGLVPGPGWGGNGGDGGTAGNGGAGGNGGAVTVNVVAAIQDSLLTTSVSSGAGGGYGTAGQYGQGGQGAEGGYEGGWGPPGHPGLYGSPGAAGAAGTAAIAPNGQFTNADLSEQTTLAQLQMLQQQADSAFLGQDYATAARIYNLLIALTQGAVGAAQPTPELKARAAINTACLCELSRMKQGLDFFGLRADWAPTLTLDLLQTEIQTMLDLSGQLGDSLAVLEDAQQSAEQKRQALEAAEAKATARLTATQQQIIAVGTQLDTFVDSLALQLTEIDNQYAVVGGLVAQLEEDLWEKDHPGCSTMRALTVCGSVISTGLSIEDGFNAVTKAGEALFESGNLVEGLTNGISLIQTVSNSPNVLNDAYNNIAGLITPSTPDGGKLLTDEASYDAWVDPLIGQYAVAAELKSAVTRYFDLVKTRNGNVLSYNAAILHKQRLQAEADQQTAVFEQIAAELAAQNDPTNPAYTAYLQSADAQTRLYLLRRLNDEIRAFMYCSVNGDMGAAAAPTLPTDTQLSSLQAAQLNIASGIEAWQDAGSPLGAYQAHQIAFTREAFPDAFAALTASCQPVDGQTPSSGLLLIRSDIVRDGLAFMDMYHVVAMSVRVILPDLAGATSGTLIAEIAHGGSSVFQKADGVTNVRFTHQVRSGLYEHNYATGQDVNQATMGDPKQGFAGLSPFSDWILKLRIDDDPGLTKISALSGVTLEFTGSFLPPQLR